MKRALYFSLVIFVIFNSSCNKDLADDSMRGLNDKISVSLQLQMPRAVESRAVDESAINDLHVLVYKGGNRFSAEYLTTVSVGTMIPDISVPEHPYTIYAVANTGDASRFNTSVTESQFLAECQTMTLLSEVTPNDRIVLSGSITVPNYPGQVTIPLQRVAAKLLVTVNNNSPALSLVGMRFGSLANRSYYISQGSSDAATGVSSYYSSDWLSISSGVQQRTYVFENQKGTGVNKMTSKAAPSGAAYIELLAKKLDTGDRYVYRIYLGENNTTDYNVKRNYEYTITINLKGVAQITTDVRVTKYTSIGYAENGLFLHYDGIWNGGVGVSVTNSNLLGRNQWVNLGYGGPDYNLLLARFLYTSSDGWNSDCLVFPSDRTRYATSIALKPSDRPATGTLEVVFRGATGSQTLGYTMAAVTKLDTGQPYSVFECEYFYTGLGFVAATDWNGKDYTNANIKTNKCYTAVQFDGNKCIGFFNGSQVFQEIKAYPTLPYALLSYFIVGNWTSGVPTNGFYGRIYSVRFYDRVLTAAEIQANYTVDKLRFGL